jgi:hypothetical protein
MCDRRLSRSLSADAVFDDDGFGGVAAVVDGVDGRDAGGVNVVVGGVVGCVVAVLVGVATLVWVPIPEDGADVELVLPLELDGPLIVEPMLKVVVDMLCSEGSATASATRCRAREGVVLNQTSLRLLLDDAKRGCVLVAFYGLSQAAWLSHSHHRNRDMQNLIGFQLASSACKHSLERLHPTRSQICIHRQYDCHDHDRKC